MVYVLEEKKLYNMGLIRKLSKISRLLIYYNLTPSERKQAKAIEKKIKEELIYGKKVVVASEGNLRSP